MSTFKRDLSNCRDVIKWFFLKNNVVPSKNFLVIALDTTGVKVFDSSLILIALGEYKNGELQTLKTIRLPVTREEKDKFCAYVNERFGCEYIDLESITLESKEVASFLVKCFIKRNNVFIASSSEFVINNINYHLSIGEELTRDFGWVDICTLFKYINAIYEGAVPPIKEDILESYDYYVSSFDIKERWTLENISNLYLEEPQQLTLCPSRVIALAKLYLKVVDIAREELLKI